MRDNPYRTEENATTTPSPARTRMPKSVMGWTVLTTVAGTALGLGLVVAAGLVRQQMQSSWWDRPAMIVGCALLLPIILVGNLLEHQGGPGAAEVPLTILGLPLQALWYSALSWLGLKMFGYRARVEKAGESN